MSNWGLSEKQANEIVEFVRQNPYCGIIAPTGSGKSTLMVEKIFKENDDIKIFVTQPTIPSAKSLYEYMSKRLGKGVVGYAAEGDVKYDSNTSIVYCTAGHLRRKMLGFFNDGRVESGTIDFCNVLMLDEAHNGSTDNDVITELWIEAVEQGAQVPRLVLASATLSKESTVLEDLPTYEIITKSLPVEIEYAKKDYTPDSKELYTDLSIAIANKHNITPVKEDDVSKWIVFCSGKNEVDSICNLLKEFSLDKTVILPAHSKLTPEELALIFAPVELGHRLIIVSTNIAEASITIDGLDGVFDSLTEKVGETSASGGLRLVVKHVSKSSAAQRKGRTGRTRPGFCYRMCTKPFFDKLPEQREPEISRVPLTGIIVELLNVGLDPISIFKNRVTDKRLKETMTILRNLNMVNEKYEVTDSGDFATYLPLSIYNSYIIYNWATKTSLPLYPIVVLACLLDSYGPSFYFYPKKEEGMSAKEYDIMKRKHYKQYFQKYEAVNDLETMMKMWNDMIGEFKTLKPGYNEILMWSKDHSFNNKKIQELFKVVKQCVQLVGKYFGRDIPIGPFNERKAFRLAEPFIADGYYNYVFKHMSGNTYFNKKSNQYYIIDHRQTINITSRDTPKMIVALRLAEIASSGDKSMKTISLYIPYQV